MNRGALPPQRLSKTVGIKTIMIYDDYYHHHHTITRDVYPLLRQIALNRSWPASLWISSNLGVVWWWTPTPHQSPFLTIAAAAATVRLR